MKYILMLLSAFFLATGWAFADGSFLETRVSETPPQKITLDWTMNELGSVVVTSQFVRATLNRVVYVPGTAGYTNAFTLKDSQGVDLLAGQGASMVTGVTYTIIPGTLVVTASETNLFCDPMVNDRLVLSVISTATNNASTGTVIIYGE